MHIHNQEQHQRPVLASSGRVGVAQLCLHWPLLDSLPDPSELWLRIVINMPSQRNILLVPQPQRGHTLPLDAGWLALSAGSTRIIKMAALGTAATVPGKDVQRMICMSSMSTQVRPARKAALCEA